MMNDMIKVMELVKMKKPLSALDFCYSGETDTISILVIYIYIAVL